jgi:hypothetical protein
MVGGSTDDERVSEGGGVDKPVPLKGTVTPGTRVRTPLAPPTPVGAKATEIVQVCNAADPQVVALSKMKPGPVKDGVIRTGVPTTTTVTALGGLTSPTLTAPKLTELGVAFTTDTEPASGPGLTEPPSGTPASPWIPRALARSTSRNRATTGHAEQVDV